MNTAALLNDDLTLFTEKPGCGKTSLGSPFFHTKSFLDVYISCAGGGPSVPDNLRRKIQIRQAALRLLLITEVRPPS